MHPYVMDRSAPRTRKLWYQEMGVMRDMVERQRIEAASNAGADAWARAVRVLFAYAAPTLRTPAMMCYNIHVSPNGRLFCTCSRSHPQKSLRGGTYHLSSPLLGYQPPDRPENHNHTRDDACSFRHNELGFLSPALAPLLKSAQPALATANPHP